jgi:SAM-dependent methyltransferase
MRAGEVRTLAHRARIGPGVSVLDLCCGVAGPGRMITAELGCHYLGVDYSASALATAQERAGNLPCRFEQAHLPPLPRGCFEVVLLLETMLAFPDKEALVGEAAPIQYRRRAGVSLSRSRKAGRSASRSGRRCPAPIQSGSSSWRN